MSSELIAVLIETTLASSAALLLVLALRRPMRVAFGAGATYGLWALVPIALVAVLLPAPVRPAVLVPMVAKVGEAQALEAVPVASSVPWMPVLIAIWVIGALAVACVQAWQQRRFLQRLGPLRMHAHGLGVAATSAGLPAVTGVLRPRIVLPADFLQRYDVDERALVVAHERQHIARGDLPCNALVALLRCAYWFNPLLHWAVARYRHDQELACDARVLQRHPHARRTYAQAMLKTQLDAFALPVGCHWHTHPIKERIAMLKRPSPRRWQTGLSSALLLALFAGGGYAAWAQQPAVAAATPNAATAPQYSLKFDLTVDGEQSNFEMRGRAKVPMAFKVETKAGNQWDCEITPEAYGDGLVKLSMSIKRNGEETATPVLITREGVAASVKQQPEAGDTTAAAFEVSVVANTTGQSVSALQDKPLTLPGGPVFSGNVRVASQGQGLPTTVDGDSAAGFYPQARPEHRPPPLYPVDAAQNGVTGHVVLLVDVAADGHVVDATVSQAEPAGVFEAAALQAVRNWMFNPAMKDGKHVAGRVRVPIDFDIDPQDPTATTMAGGVKRADYGWYKTDLQKGETRDMRCDVLVMGEKGKEQDAACGIRKPVVEKASSVTPAGTKILADVVPDGTTSNVHLDTDRKPDERERAIMAALSQFRQTPPMKDGLAVAGQVAIDTRQAIDAPPGFLVGR
ncbi:TonB family C-terminal domain-containing protein [Pseudoxanthomonas sp. GM95]|uniref:TonB family protein n=1 Tax=Pseudoxanthomonas sp. GM95 TaxID=1881043 RepID=UPI0008BE641F|nr:TonB family protein [Pseudoxanthomonas sp. GM95]SEL70939.1 TonB family C-terminal domain-containing protein [Pseudoxanthomonas sp. GM95]